MALVIILVSEDWSISNNVLKLETVYTREFFLPDRTEGKERVALIMLQGINELHHTLANFISDYAADESKARPINSLSEGRARLQSKVTWGSIGGRAVQQMGVGEYNADISITGQPLIPMLPIPASTTGPGFPGFSRMAPNGIMTQGDQADPNENQAVVQGWLWSTLGCDK
jgi:hypothetical protein